MLRLSLFFMLLLSLLFVKCFYVAGDLIGSLPGYVRLEYAELVGTVRPFISVSQMIPRARLL